MHSPALDSPIDLIVMIVLAAGSFLWAVRAGGPTEELAEILAAQRNAATKRPGVFSRENGEILATRAETTGS
jgi:hypothetical protein